MRELVEDALNGPKRQSRNSLLSHRFWGLSRRDPEGARCSYDGVDAPPDGIDVPKWRC